MVNMKCFFCEIAEGNNFPYVVPLENMKTSENFLFFCYQGVKEETSGMKWVKIEEHRAHKV